MHPHVRSYAYAYVRTSRSWIKQAVIGAAKPLGGHSRWCRPTEHGRAEPGTHRLRGPSLSSRRQARAARRCSSAVERTLRTHKRSSLGGGRAAYAYAFESSQGPPPPRRNRADLPNRARKESFHGASGARVSGASSRSQPCPLRARRPPLNQAARIGRARPAPGARSASATMCGT